jgi:hypothetical protein
VVWSFPSSQIVCHFKVVDETTIPGYEWVGLAFLTVKICYESVPDLTMPSIGFVSYAPVQRRNLINHPGAEKLSWHAAQHF